MNSESSISIKTLSIQLSILHNTITFMWYIFLTYHLIYAEWQLNMLNKFITDWPGYHISIVPSVIIIKQMLATLTNCSII